MANRLSMLTSSKTAIWNTSQIAFPQQSSLANDFKLLLMIRHNIFAHFSKQWSLIFTQMHGEKVGVVKLVPSADAYKHCLNIINAFSVQ